MNPFPTPFSSTKPAEAGNLIFLAAGDKSLFDDAADMMQAMGKMSLFLGPVGAGTPMVRVASHFHFINCRNGDPASGCEQFATSEERVSETSRMGTGGGMEGTGAGAGAGTGTWAGRHRHGQRHRRATKTVSET